MPKKEDAKKAGLNPETLHFVMEKTLREVTDKSKGDAEEQAQDLVYQALEADSLEEHLALLLNALKIDPHNVDAALMLLDTVGLDGEERIEALAGIVETGAKKLGKKAFRKLAPDFWGFLETRPYMRAREQLAMCLFFDGRLEDAIREFQEMLMLNEKDNQGVRFYLLVSLLAMGKLGEARAVLIRYPEDCKWNVVFSWGLLLERLISGDDEGTAKALADARKQNPHLEIYLKGQRKVPKKSPETYSPGSKEEALCFIEPLLMAWRKHPEALKWLLSQQSGSTESV
jgi:tetratricopeptide (TPR) repeat protein